jgi:hypothetical protein
MAIGLTQDRERKKSGMRPKDWKMTCEQFYPGIDSQKQYNLCKDEWYWKEIEECGKPISTWSRRDGGLKEVNRRCKHYKDCHRCGSYKKQEESKFLTLFIDTTRYTEVSPDEKKKLVRKYGSDNVRCIPLDNGQVGIVIKTDDDVGEVFTNDIKNKLVDNCIPTDGRRISGKLGKASVPVQPEMSWDEIEKQAEDPVIQCHYREMEIKYDSKDEGAPGNSDELTEMTRNEVEIYESPDTEEKLQDAQYLCEQKVSEICERYGMSFNFLVRKIDNLRISDVNWQWTANKRPPA